eukprot:Filipodium_phascolosomae@DN1628_c0_g1_i2.p1
MIAESDFWTVEEEAPLLRKNNGFVHTANTRCLSERCKSWVQLVVEDFPVEVILQDSCDDQEIDRIIRGDAERTFQTEVHRNILVSAAQTLWKEVQDYHQGSSYVLSFLLLFLEKQDVCAIGLCLWKSSKYIPGYWKAAPPDFVRDAKVYQKTLEIRMPEVAEHLQKCAIVPEAYASKWFVGLCVHVLPFEQLINFFENFFTHGHEYLFKFALSLVTHCHDHILATKDVGQILEILRLDLKQYSYDALCRDGERGLFCAIVEDAVEIDMDGIDIDALRKEAEKDMAVEAEARKKREAELAAYSDDEVYFSDED